MNKTLAVVFIAILIIFLVTTTVVFYRKDKVQIRKSMVPASQCQVQNCHGLEVSCGPKAAQICTEIYMEGDSCRKFIDCQVVNNQCAAVKQNRS